MKVDIDISTFYPHRPGIRKVLGDLEAEIMEFIWSQPETDQGLIVRTIFEVIYARRRIAYTTVMSTMARLAKKNLLRVEKQDQAYIYYPNITRQEFISYFVGRIVEDLCASFSCEMLDRMKSIQHTHDVLKGCRLCEESVLQDPEDAT